MSFDSFMSIGSRLPFREKKSVTFHQRVKVVEIPSASLLSRKEKKALWYPEPPEPGEEKSSKIRQWLCAKDILDKSGEECRDDDNYDFDEFGNKKHFPVTAVLDEQKCQRELGVKVDCEFIAKIYRECSAHSVYRARMRALQDQMDVEEYLSKPSRTSSRRKGLNMFRLPNS